MPDNTTLTKSVKEFFAYDPDKDQWSDEPVPEEERMGVWGPTSVWIGFAIAYIVAFIGAQIYFGLGMPDAIYAIVLGNLILVVYSGALAYAAAEGGLNFPLQVKEAFGSLGALIPIAIMGLLVNGWYAYQAWLAADVIRAAWSPPWLLLAVGITVLYGIPSIIGIEALEEVVTKLVIPLMLIAGIYMLVVKVLPAGASILNKPAPGEQIPFMVGVGLAWGTFAVSGTATGDIVRFASSTRNAIIATVVAFLICNTGMMVLGALVAATLPELSLYFGMIGLLASIPLVIVAFVSCFSTCDACHYGATMSYTNLHEKITWRTAAVGAMLISVIAVVSGIISNLLGYLILIGIVVPPIGAIILSEFFIVRKYQSFDIVRKERLNIPAIISLILAIGLNYYVYNNIPVIPTGLAGLLLAFILYPVLDWMRASISGEDSVRQHLEGQADPIPDDD
ncbi:purine-cytosine permease family protein [Haloglomus litoreum]|uniref:purine-cytosine permease family protein n=1 Tax=Haloglomus litoreum TaxID=3034026 RepID=UPI0023E8BF56|nr:cytosine permease [Haloglomus sp. DT116]